ncbi:MAG: hypothetical protein NE334_08285 [Lentisphaeraceae bacterium]|nr:hypothetical protein [Lentisphaeraceae bacterium]
MEEKLVELLKELGCLVSRRCQKVFDSDLCLSDEVKVSPADIIYQIDIEAEEVIVLFLEQRAAEFGGIILLAEGIGEEDLSIYPKGLPYEEAKVKIICDPIDGSRGLMFAKRSAFFLAAAGSASAMTLGDMNSSVMVEIPIPKQTEWDILSATRKGELLVERVASTGLKVIETQVSAKQSVEGGFLSLAKYCYPGKRVISEIEESLLNKLFVDREECFLPVFDDQYISSGGQMYELIVGHDCMVGDFRARMYEDFAKKGVASGQVCHPYDLAGLLVAQKAGVIITDAYGHEFDSTLEMTKAVDWLGYANDDLRQQVEAPLLELLQEKFGK